MRKRRIVINADDFGRSLEINQAVERAYSAGVLRSASWMACGEAAEDAVELARALPGLAVGLHVVAVDGSPILPPREVPHLAGARGRFLDDPLRAGLRYFFSRPARRELAREIRAQFERFAATGLPLSHVDGHMHMHLHPAIFPLVVELAREFGASAVRLPRDDLALALRSSRRHALRKAARGLAFALLSRQALGKARAAGLVVTSRAYGLLESGNMSERYVLEVLRRLRVPSAELFFHPTTSPRGEPLGPNSGDLETLLSAAVREACGARAFELTTFPSLANAGSEP